MPPAEGLSLALQYHQAGRFQAAEQVYREVLGVDPTNVAAWHLLGRLADQMGQRATAVKCLQQALSLWPDYAEAHSDLGTVLEAQGKLDEAAAAYGRAIDLKPQYAEAHFNLGNCQRKQRDRAGAIKSFQAALNANPNLAPAHANLASMLTEEGKLDEAVKHFNDALRLMPQYPLALFGLGFALQQQGNLNDAVAQYRLALDAQPDNADAEINLGTILEQQGSLDEAVGCYRRVLELKPDHVRATNNLGRLLWIGGSLDEAITRIRSALSFEPECAEALNNLGIVHFERQEWNEAASCFERAIELKPDLAEARLSRAHYWLQMGNYVEGWPEYEWRWKVGQAPCRQVSQPRWRGEPLVGRPILLQAEQGLGDTLQFIRYAEVLQRGGASVLLECPKALVPLLARCKGVNQVIGEGEELPPFDFYTPLLSVPGVLQTELNTVPANIPYLSADPLLVTKWREKLGGFIPSQGANRLHRHMSVGVNWHGQGGIGVYRRRDIPLEMLATLSELPGVQLVSLQKGKGASEFAAVAGRPGFIDLGREIDMVHGAFMDTAAIMMNLDLVITSDTSVAHLAGALGVPVWVALPFIPNWRWLLDRNDSPWYPTMRLFRQKKTGDWAGVFEEIEAALSERVQGSTLKAQS